jgi:hypothetical protein
MVNRSGVPGEPVGLDPERLAYWYFRLNGFLTTVNFVVHPEEGPEQRTDADILGVRFPHRAELLTNPLPDDPLFAETRPYIVIAEVKTGRCKLNGPWTRRNDRNVQRVLAAIGAVPSADWDEAAQAIYDHGVYENPQVYITLCCLGDRQNPHHSKRYLRVPQILWPHVAQFIYTPHQHVPGSEDRAPTMGRDRTTPVPARARRAKRNSVHANDHGSHRGTSPPTHVLLKEKHWAGEGCVKAGAR